LGSIISLELNKSIAEDTGSAERRQAMKKRTFLGAATLAAAAAPVASRAANKAARGPVLLTLTGAIGKPHRGPLDPALDQMMYKQKISFEKAYALDFAALASLPAVHIKPTLEYDGKAHALHG